MLDNFSGGRTENIEHHKDNGSGKYMGLKNFFYLLAGCISLRRLQVLVRALKYVDEDIAAFFIGPNCGYLGKTLNLAGKIGVKRKVHYLSYVNEKTKIEALDSATALVLPSLADHVEVYSIVVSESWARE
jgi:glycosyltransferase involved in cell wall biosynthesis